MHQLQAKGDLFFIYRETLTWLVIDQNSSFLSLTNYSAYKIGEEDGSYAAFRLETIWESILIVRESSVLSYLFKFQLSSPVHA